tara:strand:- start:259 stop:1269 length:1011 start_codon:yes stop_codon:yes gene_type:complete
MYINKSIFIAVILSALITVSCVKEDLSETGGNFEENFELLWQTINDGYCYLEYKNINWDSIGTVYRSQLHQEMGDKEFFSLCANMLNELKDGHVGIRSDFNKVSYGDWYLDYPQNFNSSIVERNYLGKDCFNLGGFQSQKIEDVGYLRYSSFMNMFSFEQIDDAVSQLGDITGLIIDVRDNTGGSVYHANLLASAFCREKVLCSYTRYKEGAGDNYSEYFPKYLEPQEKTVFNGNIVVLTNRLCYSATNEFVNAIRSLSNVTIIGDKTGGGGGMPYSSELYNGWEFWYSKNPLFDKEKNHIENGIEPDIYEDMDKNNEYNGIDSIIEKAINYLKNK